MENLNDLIKRAEKEVSENHPDYTESEKESYVIGIIKANYMILVEENKRLTRQIEMCNEEMEQILL